VRDWAEQRPTDSGFAVPREGAMSLIIVRLLAMLRTAAFVFLFVAAVLVYLPWGLGIYRLPPHRGWYAAGFLPLMAGAYIVLRCAFAFAWRGRGTPAPFDAPRELVVEGLYRYVRNPMYWGAFLLLIGQWMLFGWGWGGGLYLAIFAACVHVFVLIYEEPTLRGKFGKSYEDYCANVPRWIPRRTPWGKNASTI
jgi:protein-S-isoprenylcysteine O-methyltransferase Ste14